MTRTEAYIAFWGALVIMTLAVFNHDYVLAGLFGFLAGLNGWIWLVHAYVDKHDPLHSNYERVWIDGHAYVDITRPKR